MKKYFPDILGQDDVYIAAAPSQLACVWARTAALLVVSAHCAWCRRIHVGAGVRDLAGRDRARRATRDGKIVVQRGGGAVAIYYAIASKGSAKLGARIPVSVA